MKLIWQKTGDYIDCVPVDHTFVEYWLEQQDNFVWTAFSSFPQQSLIDELRDLVNKVQVDLSKVKIKLIESTDNFESQLTLNILHRRWVEIHLAYPNISKLFGNEFKTRLDRINKALHELEESWFLRLSSNNSPLTTTTLPNYFGQSNIKLPYENLGRSSYNKWLNFDESLETSDTNNFDELYNNISINLNRSFIGDPPTDYVYWAIRKGFDPVPNELLLANFSNLETKQDTYRALFMKNFVLDHNDVIFTT